MPPPICPPCNRLRLNLCPRRLTRKSPEKRSSRLPPPAPTEPPKPIHAELNDGTQVEFGLDGSVSILNKDGSKDPAPDGILTLKDGVTFTVKGGQRVDE